MCANPARGETRLVSESRDQGLSADSAAYRDPRVFGAEYLSEAFETDVVIKECSSAVSITFKEISCGTELNIVQEGVPFVIPPEMCYLGWQESLLSLANFVEPDFPG